MTNLGEMEKAQPLQDNPLAIDAVSVPGVNRLILLTVSVKGSSVL